MLPDSIKMNWKCENKVSHMGKKDRVQEGDQTPTST